MFHVSYIFLNKCLYFSYYVAGAGYLLDRPCIFIWIYSCLNLFLLGRSLKIFFFVVAGRHLVSGHNSYRACKRGTTSFWAAPHEGFIPHSKEQPPDTGRKLQQTPQGVCWSLFEQGAELCEFHEIRMSRHLFMCSLIWSRYILVEFFKSLMSAVFHTLSFFLSKWVRFVSLHCNMFLFVFLKD